MSCANGSEYDILLNVFGKRVNKLERNRMVVVGCNKKSRNVLQLHYVGTFTWMVRFGNVLCCSCNCIYSFM